MLFALPKPGRHVRTTNYPPTHVRAWLVHDKGNCCFPSAGWGQRDVHGLCSKSGVPRLAAKLQYSRPVGRGRSFGTLHCWGARRLRGRGRRESWLIGSVDDVAVEKINVRVEPGTQMNEPVVC